MSALRPSNAGSRTPPHWSEAIAPTLLLQPMVLLHSSKVQDDNGGARRIQDLEWRSRPSTGSNQAAAATARVESFAGLKALAIQTTVSIVACMPSTIRYAIPGVGTLRVGFDRVRILS